MGYYDEISTGYEELHREEQLKKIELIKKYLKVKPSDKLLDVGCGTGLTTEPWECKRYGVDPAPKLLERAHRKDEIKYRLGAAEAIPYPDNYFDVVISITAIQNFFDIEKGLKEIRRVGKDRFVLSFLKKSEKREKIINLIRKYFKVEKVVEEEKDLIYFGCKK
jgi:ubiquinone/menaquinone biosynthesis C-methylase UbiE